MRTVLSGSGDVSVFMTAAGCLPALGTDSVQAFFTIGKREELFFQAKVLFA